VHAQRLYIYKQSLEYLCRIKPAYEGMHTVLLRFAAPWKVALHYSKRLREEYPARA
jgi:hypothetical protein